MTLTRFPAAAVLALALGSTPVLAAELETGKVDVTFHISHPAKEYDAFLQPDGGYGKLIVEPGAIEKTTAQFTIKVDHFNSDNTRRDSHMLEVLEAFVYPTIEWTVERVTGVSGPLIPGVHQARASGPLTVHGVTRPLDTPIELTIGPKGALTIGAHFTILLEDFQIERPTLVFVPIANELPIIVKVETKPDPSLLAVSAAPEEPADALEEPADVVEEPAIAPAPEDPAE